MSVVVSLEDLKVRYGRAPVLHGVSLSIEEGQVYALLGRNGAGKSSLVRCLLGQRKASSGRLRLLGRDPWSRRRELMEQVGVVPEDSDAPPTMTARELSRFCAALYPRWDDTGFERRLKRFDISLKQPFGKLSRGQKAQVMLGLALAPAPRFLVLDDPTLGLDVVARRAVFEDLVDELASRPLTVLITSHDLPGVESLATHLGVLRQGRLVMDEELDSVKERFRRLDLVDARDAEDCAEIEAMEPILRSPRGRGQSVLVQRFDAERCRSLGDRLGHQKLSVGSPTLEEILVLKTEKEANAQRRPESNGGQ